MDANTPWKPTKLAACALAVASALMAVLANHLAQAVGAGGYGIFALALAPDLVGERLGDSLSTPLALVFDGDAPLYMCVAAALPWAAALVTRMAARRSYMYNLEHGSSRWGDRALASQFADSEDPDNNIILSASERIQLVPKAYDPRYDRNKNVLLIGGPGSGKTRYNIKPAMLQLNASFVVTDPKGTLLPEMAKVYLGEGGEVPDECKFRAKNDLFDYTRGPDGSVSKTLFAKKGDLVPYEVKILNLKDFSRSMRYNPLEYIRSGTDIPKVVDVFMRNTDGEGTQKGEAFWEKAEKLLYHAIFGYLFFECPKEDRNIEGVLKLIACAEAREDDDAYESPLDYVFKELETGRRWNTVAKRWDQVAPPQPDHFAVRQYRSFKKAAGKTLKSILISCAARLTMFDFAEVRELMSSDELELDKIGDRPTVFFVIMSDTSKTFSFLAAMCFYQLFDALIDHADNDCGGKLDVPVQCLLDEFANIGRIPDFDTKITTLRSRNVSCEVVLQNAGQLDRDYDKAARIIKGGCDSTVYLGGGDPDTCKEISERMGQMTIANRSVTRNEGQTRSTSNNDQILGRSLMDQAEVERLDRLSCLVLISGAYPFRSAKYKLENHPRYKYIDPGTKDSVYSEPFDCVAYLRSNRAGARSGGAARERPPRSRSLIVDSPGAKAAAMRQKP